ncbi:hypothetical protein [Paraburkholderia sp. DGU8]|uniref:hypothetical protein n=1 Tax=Paraburkholderia sp. DGU8 TaxID=3161997 RepID=UPI003465AD27
MPKREFAKPHGSSELEVVNSEKWWRLHLIAEKSLLPVKIKLKFHFLKGRENCVDQSIGAI